MRSLLVTSEDLLVFVDADLSRGSEILPAGDGSCSSGHHDFFMGRSSA